jgi:serine/threonine-protein kinase
VHRDLKPANLFYARQGGARRSWKIVDFGVSKLSGPDAGSLTREDAIVGTPDYMAPEQAVGGKIDHRTDIHALGAICYRALTGIPPFTGDTVLEVLYQVVHEMPPRPTSIVASLESMVDDVLQIALAKDPSERFDTAESFAAALRGAFDGREDPGLRDRVRRISVRHPWSERLSLLARAD